MAASHGVKFSASNSKCLLNSGIRARSCGSACVQVGVSRHSAGYEIVIASWFY